MKSQKIDPLTEAQIEIIRSAIYDEFKDSFKRMDLSQLFNTSMVDRAVSNLINEITGRVFMAAGLQRVRMSGEEDIKQIKLENKKHGKQSKRKDVYIK